SPDNSTVTASRSVSTDSNVSVSDGVNELITAGSPWLYCESVKRKSTASPTCSSEVSAWMGTVLMVTKVSEHPKVTPSTPSGKVPASATILTCNDGKSSSGSEVGEPKMSSAASVLESGEVSVFGKSPQPVSKRADAASAARAGGCFKLELLRPENGNANCVCLRL